MAHPQSWNRMLSNCRSTRCFLSPKGTNSSREAEVRFLTDSKLKTDNRETARTHTAFFFRGNEKNTLSCASPEKAPSGSATSSCLRLVGGQRDAVCARLGVCTHLPCAADWLLFLQAHGKLECDFRIQDVRSLSSCSLYS